MNAERARSVRAPSMLRSDAFEERFWGFENLPAANELPPGKSGEPSVEAAWIAWLAATIALAMCLPPAGGMTIHFEELPLEPGKNFYNGEDGSDGFISQEVKFVNTFDPTYGSWSGWSYSRETNNSASGFNNQYSAYPGGGAGSSEKYGVAFNSLDGGGVGSYPEIVLPPGKTPHSIKVANTTYVALSMLNGDAFSKKFGGPSGDAPDWFRLSVVGLDAAREPVGQVEHYLADYRFVDPAEDYVLDMWQEVDLTPLAGPGVAILQTRLHSSDMGPFGMNTPAYIAVDDLVLADSVILGDYNHTGGVDAADYTVWRDRFGDLVNPPGMGADGNGNGFIDNDDYVVWKTSFETITGTGKTTMVVDVPEPTGLCLLAIGTLATFFYQTPSPRKYTS